MQSRIFVLGDHRSGTSTVHRALRQTYRFSADMEGYVWPLLLDVDRSVGALMDFHGGPDSKTGRNFTLKRIGGPAIVDRLFEALLDLHDGHFEGSSWIDKTPGAEMIRAAGLIAARIEDARFIFLRRRGIDNVLSKRRRFPGLSFEQCCDSWRACVDAWAATEKDLGDRQLVIEQREMAHHPHVVARNTVEFLGGGDDEVRKLTHWLRDKPVEVTAGPTAPFVGIEDTPWSLEEKGYFLRTCAEPMSRLGYRINAPDFLEEAGDFETRHWNAHSHVPRAFWNRRLKLHANPPGMPPTELIARDLRLAGPFFGLTATPNHAQHPGLTVTVRTVLGGRERSCDVVLPRSDAATRSAFVDLGTADGSVDAALSVKLDPGEGSSDYAGVTIGAHSC
jgi:hypothetical protein